MNQYIHALESMHLLLTKVGEKHWANWIFQDINHGLDSSHHRSSYGGMGSFNDVVICQQNGHSVTKLQEPWANVLFNWLKSFCYQFAKDTSRSYSLQELKNEIGLHDASLSAFVGGENAPKSIRDMITESTFLQGWRCLACGYSKVEPGNIDCYLAEVLIPGLMIEKLISGELSNCIKDILNGKINGVDEGKTLITDSTLRGGIDIGVIDGGWLRPCPQCDSEDTAIYRWLLENKEKPIMVPSSDNLPLKM